MLKPAMLMSKCSLLLPLLCRLMLSPFTVCLHRHWSNVAPTASLTVVHLPNLLITSSDSVDLLQLLNVYTSTYLAVLTLSTDWLSN